MSRKTLELASRLNMAPLRSFVRVVELESISAAARSLFLTQSAVSMQLSALNSMIGTPLLQRVRGRWKVTPAGSELYASAVEMLSEIGRLESNLADLSLVRGGHVTLASTRVVSEIILAPVIAGFTQAHPDIRLDVQLYGCKEIEHLLGKRQLDAALVADPFCCDDCTTYKIADDELVAVLPAEHRLVQQTGVTVADLAKERLVSLPQRSSVWSLLRERVGYLCDDFQVEHFVASSSAVVALVEAGVGCSVLPRRAAERGEKWASVVVRPIAGCNLRRNLLIAVSQSTATQPLDLLVSWLRRTNLNLFDPPRVHAETA